MAIGPDDHVSFPCRPRCPTPAAIRWRTGVSALPPSRARRPARPLMGRSETLHVHHSGAPIVTHRRAALRELGDAAIAHQTRRLVGLPRGPRIMWVGRIFRLHHLSPRSGHTRWGGVGGGAAPAPP